MNYGSEPADQVVRYSLEGAEFALRISGTAAKNFFIFAQAVLHDSKKTHGKTHLIRLLKEQKPLRFFTVDKDRMHDFARAAKAHGLLFCPIRDKMDGTRKVPYSAQCTGRHPHPPHLCGWDFPSRQPVFQNMVVYRHQLRHRQQRGQNVHVP